MRISHYHSNTNTLIVINISWILEQNYNLLSIISLAEKDIKVFLRKTDSLFKIIIYEEIFNLPDIIED